MLDELGYQRFDVLGISWGGGLAQQLALQNPRRCRRLVLVSTATGWMMMPARPSVLMRMATPRRYRDAGYAREIAGDIYGGEPATSARTGAGIYSLTTGPRPGVATSTSSPQAQAGPACRSSR